MSAQKRSNAVIWLDDPVSRTVYSTDNSIYQVRPERIAIPDGANHIAEVLRENAQREEPLPVVARGGGTGTNGQSLTDGVVLDLKRGMNRLLSVDTEARTATVEPGIVTASLNAQLAASGLFWPPHTSTLNRATVGGMISTDAAGKGSLVYGRTHRHVIALDVVLADGTQWIAERVRVSEAERRAAEGGPAAAVWQALLAFRHEDLTNLGLPELARGFSGYGLDRLFDGDHIDPVALLCGAEGTLGIITRAKLRLSPLPSNVRLVIASYDAFDDALVEAVRLRDTGPSAVESFDETTLERGRSSPAWPALGDVIGDHQGAVLMLEYDGESGNDGAVILAEVTASGRCRSAEIVDDPIQQAQAWKVRADAVGLLAKVATGGPELSARPTAFVEDCAVPVSEMPAFIAGFRRILDREGVEYGMFGHADVGCVHVRPALDLTNADQRAMVERITGEVVDLLNVHGGLLWGEHGRGFRGSSIDRVLRPSTIELMRRIKSIFDPLDVLNPGKLYRPVDVETSLVDVGDPPMRGQSDSEVAVAVRRAFDSAFACNGNGLCHHYGASEVMCPSFKATGDPALSPKGRVDLVRQWLRDPGEDADFEHAIAENLHQCLSCSACSGHCPVEVNIPELKSRFFADYHQRHRRPGHHALLSRFEEAAMLAARAPKLAALGGGIAGRLLGLVDLPLPLSDPGPRLAKFRPGDAEVDVVIVPDVFTAALDRPTLRAAASVLAHLGYRVAMSNFTSSGKFDHVKGNRKRFAQAVGKQSELVKSIVSSGATPVVIEPAIALLHQHEYASVDAAYPSESVKSLVEMIIERMDLLPSVGGGHVVRLLGHCTERATSPATANGWVRVLESAGFVVDIPDIGCCGMAGIFGHEKANQKMSRDLWDLSWAQHVDAEVILTVTGYSCRSQAKRFSRANPRHPVTVLGEGLPSS